MKAFFRRKGVSDPPCVLLNVLPTKILQFNPVSIRYRWDISQLYQDYQSLDEKDITLANTDTSGAIRCVNGCFITKEDDNLSAKYDVRAGVPSETFGSRCSFVSTYNTSTGVYQVQIIFRDLTTYSGMNGLVSSLDALRPLIMPYHMRDIRADRYRRMIRIPFTGVDGNNQQLALDHYFYSKYKWVTRKGNMLVPVLIGNNGKSLCPLYAAEIKQLFSGGTIYSVSTIFINIAPDEFWIRTEASTYFDERGLLGTEFTKSNFISYRAQVDLPCVEIKDFTRNCIKIGF